MTVPRTTELRKHAERWMAYSDERGLMAEPLLALIDTAEAAHRIHGHGPTGMAPRVGHCALCDALARFTFGTDP